LADLGIAKHWREEAPAPYERLLGLIRTALTHSRHEGLAATALAAARVAEMRELAPEAEAIAANRECKPSLRAAAAQELAAIGRPESLPVLEACAGAQDPELRESAALALKALKDRVRPEAKTK
jgi:HEAT repeat protein